MGTKSMSRRSKNSRNSMELTRVAACRILPGDTLIFRGEGNRRVKAVHAFKDHWSTTDMSSNWIPASVSLVIANADGTALTMKTYDPETLVLIMPTAANQRRRMVMDRTQAERETVGYSHYNPNYPYSYGY